MVFVTGIYGQLARTAERHLLRYTEYAHYVQWMRSHGLLIRLFYRGKRK